jgi:hypothetical protein
VLQGQAVQMAAPYRKPGTVRNAIRVRTSKEARRAGNVGVFVNVKPLRRGGGARSPDDPFYWRFLEFGWNPASRRTGGRGAAGRRQRRALVAAGAKPIREGFQFLQDGAKRLRAAYDVFVAKIVPAIERLDKGQTP